MMRLKSVHSSIYVRRAAHRLSYKATTEEACIGVGEDAQHNAAETPALHRYATQSFSHQDIKEHS